MELTVGDFQVETVEKDGQLYSSIRYNHLVRTNQKGFAELPYMSRAVMLPPDKNVDLVVEEGAFQDIRLSYPLLPSRGVIYRSQDPETIPFTIDPASLKDAWYPGEIAMLSEPFIIRDVRGLKVIFQPFQYNAVQKVLRVYKSVKVVLRENQQTPVNPLWHRADRIIPEAAAVYRTIFVNYDKSRDPLPLGEQGEILVITTARDEAAIEPYIQWKKEKGFLVSKEVVAAGTNVKSLIHQKYNANPNIFYVLLVGDWDDIQCDLGTSSNFPMDPMLGCVAGNDNFPDICIGRFSADNPAEVTSQVNKTIEYEKNAQPGDDWFSHALGIASIEGAGYGDDGEMDKVHQTIIWNNKLSQFTFTAYDSAYEPTATIPQVKTAIESGVSLINYTGHGSPYSWGTTGFSSSEVNQLTNGDKLPWIISVACNNGEFHTTECFAENWLRKENGGAILMLASTISQPWQPPMRGQDYFMDILIGGYDYSSYPNQSGISTSEQRTTAGAIIYNGLCLMLAESNGNDDLETVQTWTTFGDPSLQVRTRQPEPVTLSNEVVMVGVPFLTTITNSSGPVPGASVTLSQNGQFATGRTDASGSLALNHPLLPGPATLVVTGFNLQTIAREINVVPANGPWVISNGQILNDTTAGGNQNGRLDYGETVFLGISAKNVGVDTTNGVQAVLATSDPHVTLLDSTHELGTMLPDTTILAKNAFKFSISDSVEDGHIIDFVVKFTGSNRDTTWTSRFTIKANAPKFGDFAITVLDTGAGCNHNGILDPGETANLKFKLQNVGHAAAFNGNFTAESLQEFLTLTAQPVSWDTLGTDSVYYAVFQASAKDTVPLGTPAELTMAVQAGNYAARDTLTLVVGEIPVILMSANGTDTVAVAKFYDSGGPNNDYQTNELFVRTFYPSESEKKIRINFLDFNTEAGWDFMWIYDGPDTNSTLINGSPFSGQNSPGQIIATNPDGAITIKFYSDGYITAPGWQAEVSLDFPSGNLNGDENRITTYALEQNYPNPFNPTTTIRYQLPEVSRVSLQIYNILGQRVRTLVNNVKQSAGKYRIVWDGKNDAGTKMASGIYIYRIQAGNYTQVRKMVLMK
ncbi:MAG: hypothetical protein Kow0037_27000 [Calditrichia bacterium]